MLELFLITYMSPLLSFWRSLLVSIFKISGWQYYIVLVTPLFVSARRAVVKQLYICKIEYYQHQMSQCDGDQRHTFVFLNNLMGCTLDPAMPTSSSDDELASRFSGFFFRRSFALGAKLMRLLLIRSSP